MRIAAPDPFTVHLTGPEGPYVLHFRPAGAWDGALEVEIAGRSLVWPVEIVELQDGGRLVLSGTTDTKGLWNDVFWFELSAEPPPPHMTYWADRRIWRTDGGEGR